MISKGDVVTYSKRRQFLVSKVTDEGAVYGRRVTDAELRAGEDLGGRDELFLGTEDEIQHDVDVRKASLSTLG